MSRETLRRAAEQARALADVELAIAPALERSHQGDDCGTRLNARRHRAVADWLDAEDTHQFGPTEHALNVARAYLGESA